ncbi:altronate dehydratase family protein [Gilvimarinus sp. SDUM040013]|uniref:Altronate dehydratase family protein n=1 Tax=Gilvimarinus gilvus TaxID=3058038 RepID=A0ABU4RYP7_9GAMM|nr:altronate dehydratase family protein [Gilvimarinus sp. SDUM040013]MDO3386221.1 altronate dehydratase family protein [Gilvimarinus sp. SDUM040013]MDX6849784.1 altronate dehydratase family protein [Gilvimarinus sp. SDUM040013]
MSKLIHLHQQDNVAIAVEDVAAGEELCVEGARFVATEDIGEMHKIAVEPIKQGDAIIKYGQFIGYAAADIAAGQHVHTHNCIVGDFAKDYGFCRHAVETDFVADAQRATFMGFKRDSGKVGTRNYIGILTTVNCSATVARQIATMFSYPGALDDFPNVDGVVALTHESGCGMRAEGEGYEILQRTFEGYAAHPNFGAVLLIGLGCETMQVDGVLAQAGLEESDCFKAYNIQTVGGTRQAVEQGADYVRKMLPLVNSAKRESCPASELTLAVQCGGSDAFSGITANPALGVAGDILVRHGGTVIYSETPEIYGAEHLLTQRSATPDVAEQLLERIRWWEGYTSTHGFELNNNPSPGNKAGGLTTILEKSLGAQAKSGSTTMTAVYQYAQPVTEKGLVFMDSPGFDPVSVTGQVASGANVVAFTTGRGSAFGYKPVPSVKLSSNTAIYKHMSEDIDINCGAVLDGEETLETLGEKIFLQVLAIASGELTKSEELGYGDAEFNPWKIGAVV